MVGFVQTRLRAALTTGQCADGPLVTDRDQHLVGTVLLARRQTTDDAAAGSAMLPATGRARTGDARPGRGRAGETGARPR
jgi:hypothetical protein